MSIKPEEYRERMARLQQKVAESDLEVFVVSAEESILYLTGVSYVPLERPFFILVRPAGEPELLVPMLERDYLGQAPSVRVVRTYWDYPSPPGEGWEERLAELIGGARTVGVEPTLPLEIQAALEPFKPVVLPLVEELRLVKSPAEIEMLRHAARYADMGVERVLATAYYGVSFLEVFSQGRGVQLAMLREVGYDAYTSSVIAGAWPAPGSAMLPDA